MNSKIYFLTLLLLVFNTFITTTSAVTPKSCLKLESQNRLETMIEKSEQRREPLNLKKHDFTKDQFAQPRKDLKNLDFTGAHLEGANFKGMRLKNIKFNDAKLQHANFEDTIIEECSFDGADLCMATFKLADVNKSRFVQAHLDGVNFRDADLTAINFEDSVLRCADMTNADLTRANLSESDLWCVTFENTITTKTNFFSTRRSCPDLPSRICRDYLGNKRDFYHH